MKQINIDSKIIHLLEKQLISPKGGLTDVYKRIQKYYQRSCEIKVKPTKNDTTELNSILPQDLLKKNELKNEYSYLTNEKTSYYYY